MNNRKLLVSFFIITFLSTNILPVFSIEDDNKKTVKVEIQKETKRKNKKTAAVDKKLEYMNLEWWNRFNDPILTDYIVKTAAENYDIKINELKVLQGKAAVQEGWAMQLPAISIDAQGSRSDYMKNYTIPIGVNYEIDIWGKNYNVRKKLQKDYEAMQYDEKAAFISLTTLTSTTYFNILNIDKQIEIQKELVNIRKEVLELTKVNFEYGLNSSMDVTQADKSYIESQSALETLKKDRAKLLNQLSVLIGSTSENSNGLQRASIDEITLLNNLPQSIETEIVNQRPDILSIEAQLKAAAFDVKAARKAMLPTLTINGNWGYNYNNMMNIFNYKQLLLTLGAGITQPVFQGGRLIAQLKGKKYKYEEMFNTYQKTILTSFQEINDSLVVLKSDTAKHSNDIKRVQNETKYFQDINFKYEKGAVSYLDTLKFKETLLAVQQEEIQSKTECLIDSLSLYKAVGGKL